MTSSNINSNKSFEYAILGVGLILVIIILTILLNTSKYDFISLLIGLLTFVIGIIGVIGSIVSIKGLKEPNTVKKIIGIILNFGIVILFLSVIIANIYDMYKAFSV